MAGLNSSKGGVARKAFTKAVQALLKSFCWARVKPSASKATLNARLRGAEPKIWVLPITAPSEVPIIFLRSSSMLHVQREAHQVHNFRFRRCRARCQPFHRLAGLDPHQSHMVRRRGSGDD